MRRRFLPLLTTLLLTGASTLLTAQNTDPFHTPPSKKGLQVQMVDDALTLGVRHAAVNVSL
ncbi:MAG TPA: hypothetical protein VLE43_02460, partial [Candidatus Saccharimonadia bacterium]|nr:hypothetical protein [Candidatus Saccharimonadia bacterium]